MSSPFSSSPPGLAGRNYHPSRKFTGCVERSFIFNAEFRARPGSRLGDLQGIVSLRKIFPPRIQGFMNYSFSNSNETPMFILPAMTTPLKPGV